MTLEEIIGLTVALLLMGVGVAGAIFPGLPSTPIVLAAAVGHRLYFGDQGTGPIVLTMLIGLTAVSAVLDYLVSMLGARELGATKLGILGAIVGGVVGLFFSLPGVILGPFVGAFVFEIMGGRDLKPAMRAGLGAMLGLLGGVVGKLVCCLVMIGLFTVNVVYRNI